MSCSGCVNHSRVNRRRPITHCPGTYAGENFRNLKGVTAPMLAVVGLSGVTGDKAGGENSYAM
jgi:hypothetical protein